MGQHLEGSGGQAVPGRKSRVGRAAGRQLNGAGGEAVGVGAGGRAWRFGDGGCLEGTGW